MRHSAQSWSAQTGKPCSKIAIERPAVKRETSRRTRRCIPSFTSRSGHRAILPPKSEPRQLSTRLESIVPCVQPHTLTSDWAGLSMHRQRSSTRPGVKNLASMSARMQFEAFPLTTLPRISPPKGPSRDSTRKSRSFSASISGNGIR